MTKKILEALAANFAASPPYDDGWQRGVRAVALVAASNNPRFKPGIFFTKCGMDGEMLNRNVAEFTLRMAL